MKLVQDCVPESRKIAEFRLMVLGDVLVLPRETGERRKTLRGMAGKKWLFPDGTQGSIGFRTLQRWLSVAEDAEDRIEALMPRERADKGKVPCVTEQQREFLRELWNERPSSRWMNHYRNLKAKCDEAIPSYSSVKRFLRSEGLYPQKRQDTKEMREKKSFESSFVNQYWHLDAHHGSVRVIDEGGNWQIAKLIAYLDDKSRYCCHAQWYLNECCREMCSSFEQSALKCGLPYGVYTDNGSGMRGTEFTEGLHRLGVILRYTGVESPYQNGKLERFWGTVESQLLQMLPRDRPLTLAELNRYTQAWLQKDYHLQRHSEIKASPEDVFFNHKSVELRRPELAAFRSAFRRSFRRKTRTTDGTVQIEGVRFQLPQSHRHIKDVLVRVASWNLSVAELADIRTGNTIAEIFPLDKEGNSHGRRAAIQMNREPDPSTPLPGLAPHLRKLCEELDQETGITNFNPTIPIVSEK